MYWSDVGHRAIAAAGINDGTGLTVLLNRLQNITTPGNYTGTKVQHYAFRN